MSTYRNSLKERLDQSLPCLGAWLTSDSTINAAAMSSMGFHFLVVDLEHGCADISQAENLFLVAERYGAAPIARISSADGNLARRLLDLGAHGIIISTVENADKFQAFSKYCLYPPHGHRGVGLSRCNRFGDNFDAYYQGFRPLLVPMIETKRGVKAAEAIAAIPEVDALFLGPYDLSADLGKPGEFNSPEFLDAVQTVKSVAEKLGKTAGIHQVEPDLKALRERLADGFGFVAYGTDVAAMRYALSGISEFTGD